MENKNKEHLTSRRECSVVLQRCESAESLRDSKTPKLSESESDVSFSSASPAQWSKRRRSDREEDDDEEEAPSPKVASGRRGRGRPPTTGRYVGLAKAQASYNAELKKLHELENERDFDREMTVRRRRLAIMIGRDPDQPRTGSEEDAAEEAETERLNILQIRGRFENSMAAVREVAKKSLNLKGTYVRHLKDAAKVGMECANALLERTSTEEVRILLAANKVHKAEINILREEMAELRREMARSAQAPAPAPAPAQPNFEEMMRSVMVQVGNMMSARLAGIEERLLPERRVRPPLAADRGKEAPLRTTADEAHPVPTPRGPIRKEAPKKGDSVATAATSEDAHPSVPEEPWTVVVSKNSKRSRKNGPAVQPVPRPARPVRPQAAKREKKKPAPVKVPRLRPPRTAAVVLTLQPRGEEGGLTYAKIIAEAKERIDLGALGVPAGVRMRTAATGAKVIEVPGAEKAALADSLAGKLREVFQNPEVVKISRPVTTADIRVSGLDESIDSTELVAAVAKAGGCSVDEIKTGLIRFGAAAMGTALVRCPVTAAKQVLARGRLLVGWVSAQVKLLPPRPRRCYKCLVQGHIRAQCQSEVDRSDECYRCGQRGHVANECSATPHCTICAAASRPAEHLSGGKACAKPPGKRVQGRRTVTVAQAKSQMEQ